MHWSQSVDENEWVLVVMETKEVILSIEEEIMTFPSKEVAEAFKEKHNVPERYVPTLVKSMVSH